MYVGYIPYCAFLPVQKIYILLLLNPAFPFCEIYKLKASVEDQCYSSMTEGEMFGSDGIRATDLRDCYYKCSQVKIIMVTLNAFLVGKGNSCRPYSFIPSMPISIMNWNWITLRILSQQCDIAFWTPSSSRLVLHTIHTIIISKNKHSRKRSMFREKGAIWIKYRQMLCHTYLCDAVLCVRNKVRPSQSPRPKP